MKKYIKNVFSSIGFFLKKFTMKDFLFFAGLIQLFVGLYLYNPWVAPTATGTIMIVTGLFGKDAKGGKN